MEFVDSHIHIIPKVDDGSTDMKCSIEMVETLYKQGVREIVATPHNYAFTTNFNLANENYLKLKHIVKNVNIHLGCEIYCEPLIMSNILQNLHNGIYPSINNTRYVLVEFDPYEIDFSNIIYCVKELTNANWIPIIAHIERYYFTTIKRVKKLKQLGCKMQMNIFSIANESNQSTRELARNILNENLVDILGSDSHNKYHRPPNVKKGLNYLQKHYDETYVKLITTENAKQYFNL